MNKLKIAFVISEFPTITETFILNQVTFLIDQGHHLSIYSRAKGSVDQIHPEVSSYNLLDKTVYIPPVPKSFIKRLKEILKILIIKKSLKFSIELIRCCNFFKIGRPASTLYAAYNYAFIHSISKNDIIHAHFGPSGLWMALYKKVGLLNDIKLFVSFHGVDIMASERLINKKIYQNLFQYANYCTVNSLYSRHLLDEIPTPKGEIVLLPVGLKTKKFNSSRHCHSDQVEILFCGRLIRLKAPDLAIEIFHELIKQGVPNIGLTIIGEGPERKKLTSMINNYNLNEKIKLVGAKTQEELIKYYQNADIFLFPGIHDPRNKRCETQGLVVQEAQAMEIPVVVSDVGGIKYGMIDGVTGIVVQEGDIQAFVEALKILVCDSNLRSKMGKAGREFVLNHFDADSLGFQLESLYYKVLNN